jgi:UDP-glucuronate 4-epimerase
MKKTILVTGAAGFIGSHLAERLLEQGYIVLGLDNFDDFYSPALKHKNISLLKEKPNFQLLQADICDKDMLNRIFNEQNIDIVAHLAAKAGVRPSIEQPALYQDVNIGGTINLLEASQTYQVERFIFASSSSVYGLNTQPPFSEESVINYPISPYAASKAGAELFCRTYNHLYGLPIMVLRPFTVYGPRQRPEMAIQRFTKLIDQGEEVTIFGDGTAKRDYTYVDDIVSGFEAAIISNSNDFCILNLGNGNAVELSYLIRLIEKAVGKKAKIENMPDQPGDVPITLADVTRARQILGYKSRVTIEDGISRFVQSYINDRR